MSSKNEVVLPCLPGDDCWFVDSETLEVECEKGGITAVVVYADRIEILDLAGEPRTLHSQWCCLSREEAEAFREKLLNENLH